MYHLHKRKVERFLCLIVFVIIILNDNINKFDYYYYEKLNFKMFLFYPRY